MKNKKVTYIMIVLALVVWGMILYRVFSAVSGNDDNAFTPAIHPPKEPFRDYAATADTVHLKLNYRDPFGLQKKADTTEIPVRQIAHISLPQPAKPAFNWSFIKYSGFIRNPGSKKLIAILSVNGKNVMMAEGESAEQVKLLKNLKDSVKIAFNGKTKFITMSPEN